MQIPLQITFKGLGRSEALEGAIRDRAARLERFKGDIMSCRVVLETAGRHKKHGRQYSVHIDVKVKGSEIAVTREHDEDMHIAISEAFDAARQQLTKLNS